MSTGVRLSSSMTAAPANECDALCLGLFFPGKRRCLKLRVPDTSATVGQAQRPLETHAGRGCHGE